MTDAIEELKALPPLTQQVCGSCRYFRRSEACYGAMSHCEAMSILAAQAWPMCKGRYWEPPVVYPPILVRLKRWLVG